MYGEFDVKLKDGTTHKGRPVWDIWAEYLEGLHPQKVSEITEVDAQLLTDACLEWATRDDPRIPNGGINYGLAIEHHGMSTQNCRAIMAACAMVGAIDTPGGQRGATNGWAIHPVGPHVHVPWRRRRLEPRLLRARACSSGCTTASPATRSSPCCTRYAVWA